MPTPTAQSAKSPAWLLAVPILTILTIGLNTVGARTAATVETVEIKTVAAPAPAPTATKTVEVPVPGPTVTVPGPAVTTKVAPEGCLKAIEDARQVAQVSADFAGVMVQYPPMVAAAYQAGVLGSERQAQDVIDDMHARNKDLDKLNNRLSPLVDAFNKHAADCKG